MSKKDIISASELGDYVFCKRGWWLRFNGLLNGENESMIKGIAFHEQLVTSRRNYTTIKKLAFLFILFGLIILIISFLLPHS